MPFGPSQADLHVNTPLTQISVAWFQDKSKYIADSVFPAVPSEKQSDYFNKFGKHDWLSTNARKRAPGTESAGTGWQLTRDTFFCEPYAVHDDIDDQARANSDSEWNLDKIGTMKVVNDLRLARDVEWSQTFFTTGVWSTQKTGVSAAPAANQFLNWDDDASDPVTDVDGWLVEFEQKTGFRPNKLVLGIKAYNALKNNASILDRIKWSQKGIVGKDLLATLFEVDEIIIPRAIKATGPQTGSVVGDDAGAALNYVHNPEAALFVYAPSTPSKELPSAGYTFTWKGYMGGNADGIRISKFRMEHLKADRIEGEMAYDMKVVAPECGLFLSSILG